METLGILIIEGKGGLARALLASREGFSLIHAERMSQAESLAAPARAAGGFAAILVDLALPDCQGEDAYRRAAALLPGTPIVALQRGPDPALEETLMGLGAQACLAREGLDGGALAASLRQAVLRRRAEARRFRSLWDAAPLGILLAAGRRVLWVNAAAREMLGHDEAGFASLSVLAPFPPAARPLLEGALDAPAPADARFSADLARRDGSTFRCRVHLAAATFNDAPAIALFLAPWTEGAAAPGAPAHQAGKMEALNRLAEGVAHDFGNFLTAINGYSEHLLSLAGDQGPFAPGLRSILRAGESAADFARQLGTLARPEGGEAAPVDVDAALRGFEPILKRMLGPGIDLRVEPAAGGAAALLEPGRLERILMGLCANARDAMPEGGVLRIASQAAEVGPGTAFTHLAAGPGPAVAITVEDDGIGMGPDTLERLFEPFYSTKRGGRGRGLGLTAVYGMVERAGGGIAVESAPGSGSRFRIILPCGPAAAGPDPAHAADAAIAAASLAAPGDAARGEGAAGPAQGGRVLVVEDDPSLREMFQAILERSGFAVIATGSPEDAADALAQGEEWDLLLTDVMLRGGEGGDELAERLQALRPGLRVLFVSGHPLEVLAERGIRVPADAFLEKPFTPAGLAAKVRAVLGAAREAS